MRFPEVVQHPLHAAGCRLLLSLTLLLALLLIPGAREVHGSFKTLRAHGALPGSSLLFGSRD